MLILTNTAGLATSLTRVTRNDTQLLGHLDPPTVDYSHKLPIPTTVAHTNIQYRSIATYAPTDVELSDGESEICDICDIGDICEKAVFGVLGVSGVTSVPDVPHGLENGRAKCVSNAGGPSDRASNSCHSDMCTSPPGLGGFGDIQFAYMDAPVSDDAGVGNRSFSETPDFASDHDPGPGKPSPGSGNVLEMLDFVSNIDTGPRKPSPKSY